MNETGMTEEQLDRFEKLRNKSVNDIAELTKSERAELLALTRIANTTGLFPHLLLEFSV